MLIKKLANILIALSLFSAFNHYGALAETVPENTRLGMWVTVFSDQNVLLSEKNVDRMLDTAKTCGIDDIYMQVYRADKAYYDSSITDASPYKNIVSNTGFDTFSYLVKKAKTRNISVHAWINLLSISQNAGANIIKTFGKDVLTLDQHGRTSLKDNSDPLDKYYLRENQLFLEPGNPNVRKYLVSIVSEIAKKYPSLTGIHLDYIRYPSIVPFIPGSRFTPFGLSYGYDKENLASFKKTYDIDIVSDEYSRKNFLLWDDWRRNNVTALLKNISESVRNINPDLKISCTIIPSMERTYLTVFQDWTQWLDKGYADYVVAMNYTDDVRLFDFYANSILSQSAPERVMMGTAAYLTKDDISILFRELESLIKSDTSGIIIFSYDDIAENKKLQEFLAERFREN